MNTKHLQSCTLNISYLGTVYQCLTSSELVDKQQTFITKEKAENIVKEYLHGDDKEIESITSGKGNTYYINAFVKVNARQKIGTSIKMDRTSGQIQSLMQVNS